jgi:protein-disulfide isomerase
MHDRLFANQSALDGPSLEKHAADIGLDVARWKTAMENGRAKGRVEADTKLAEQLAVNGTPSFFVNGRPIVGAQPLERFKAVIDEELKKAEERVAQGTSKDSYYRTWVIEKGLKRLEAPKQ